MQNSFREARRSSIREYCGYQLKFAPDIKSWICDNTYADGYVKVRHHCHIVGKYSSSEYRDCNINVKLNHKIHILFHILSNYDSCLIIIELRKFNFEINSIPNGLEKYMSFEHT